MRKFSRPDISITNVPKEQFDLATRTAERFISYFASGELADEQKPIVLNELNNDLKGTLKGDYENLDFNNYYFEINWKE